MRPDPAPELIDGPDAMADLAALLREERAMILEGAWARLGDLAARKAAGLAALLAAGAGALGPLAAELGRNQRLLGAAIEGFRDAGQRRAMLRSARVGLTTYDAQGLRGSVAAVRPTVERKA